jgi:hypothetical protein
LSHKFKLEILHRWEQDARQLAEAESEGMRGGEDSMLARVRRALRELDFEAADKSPHITGVEVENAAGGGQLAAIADKIEGLLNQRVSEARTAIRAQPLTAGLLALAVGFLAGRLNASRPPQRYR